MTCPKCSSENVTVTTEQVSSKTKKNGAGCLWGIGRLCLIICTGGLWLLIGKHKGKEKTKIKNKTVCLCQSCAYKWYV